MIPTIALFAPIAASSAIFSCRRASRGANSMEEMPLYGLANFDIAAGQILKAGRAVKGMTIAVDPKNNALFTDASKRIIDLTKDKPVLSKTLKCGKGVIDYTANHINPLICVASGIKVLGSEDKAETLADETIKLGCMFGAENLTKKLIGMPSLLMKNGEVEVKANETNFFTKRLSEKQMLECKNIVKDVEGILKKLNVKPENANKYTKTLFGLAKGMTFVGASISGYKIGEKVSKAVINKDSSEKQPEKTSSETAET